MGWGISDTASDKEKIKAYYNDILMSKNSVGKISYIVYSQLYDIGIELLDKMYVVGKNNDEDSKERIYAEFNFSIAGLNLMEKMSWEVYEELFATGIEELNKMYELGRNDGEIDVK